MTTTYFVPYEESSLFNAARWVEGVSQGSVAASIATLAIAALAFRMLRGEYPMRRALSVILGCFIVFGASYIVRGLAGSVLTDRGDPETPSVAIALGPEAREQPATKPPTRINPDPYAGASLNQ